MQYTDNLSINSKTSSDFLTAFLHFPLETISLMFDVCSTSWSYFKSIKFRWVSFRLFFFFFCYFVFLICLASYFRWYFIVIRRFDCIFYSFSTIYVYCAVLCSARRAFSIIFPIPFACYCCFNCHQNLFFFCCVQFFAFWW